MRRSRAFRAAGWESLEGRSLLSTVAGPSPVVPAQRSDAYTAARLAANLRLAAQGRADIVLLGDSNADLWTTRGAASWKAVMAPRGAVDFGIAGNTTRDVRAQIAAGELVGKPKVVVLMIGTNDLARGESPAQVAQGIAACVSAIRSASPRSHVLLLGLLPMAGAGNAPQTQKVSLVNALIARLDDGAHVHFLNMGGAYVLSNGSQNRALFVDSVHLSASGYSVWAGQISGPLDALTGRAAPPQNRPVTPPPAPPPTAPPRYRRRA